MEERRRDDDDDGRTVQRRADGAVLVPGLVRRPLQTVVDPRPQVGDLREETRRLVTVLGAGARDAVERPRTASTVGDATDERSARVALARGAPRRRVVWADAEGARRRHPSVAGVRGIDA